MLSFSRTHQGLAQSNVSAWSDPINLSQSGGTSTPQIVVDFAGRIHVYWWNEFDGLTYTFRDLSGSWVDPISVQAPFEESLTTLQFLSDPRGFIHALWLDELGNLLYSRTINQGESLTWESPRIIERGIAGFRAVLGKEDKLHLTYIKTEESPHGIYYRAMGETGGWSFSLLIYQSPYFRNLTPEDSHIWIDVGKDNQIFLSWDDRYTEQVFLVGSKDSGETWSDPILMDQRNDGDGLDSVGPSNIMIQSNGDNTLIIWQAGHEGTTCSQYYVNLSLDQSNLAFDEGGFQNTDIKGQKLPGFKQECPDQLQVYKENDGRIWLLAKSGNELQLSTWSGPEWSPFQSKKELSEFIHPITYRRLDLDCFQYVFFQSQLMVLGCDTGVANDIWFTEWSLGETDTWFPTSTPAPLWSTPVIVSPGDDISANPVLLPSPSGRTHAVWSAAGGKIYYTHFDGDRWAQPVIVLTSPGEHLGKLSAGLDHNANLFVAWDIPGSESIYYSWVNEKDANISQQWMPPQVLPIFNIARSPQVAINALGQIELAYVIPLNESRGVYWIKTKEPIQIGQSLEWDSPELVIDAAAAGWSMVDDVRFSLGIDGTKIILWTNYDTPPDGSAISLYNTLYMDGAWSEPTEIYQDSILWSQVLNASDGTMHSAWQVKDNLGQVILWHSFSTDYGLHWSNPIRILNFQSDQGSASLVLDDSGRLHLIQVGQSSFISLDGRSSLILQNLVFNGTEWTVDERITLENLINPGFLSASTSLDGNLAALLSADIVQDLDESGPTTGLFYSQRPVDSPETLPTSLPTFTPNPAFETVNSTPEPSPTPKPVFPTDRGTQTPSLLNNRWAGIIVGGVPAIIIVGLVLLFILRKVNKR